MPEFRGVTNDRTGKHGCLADESDLCDPQQKSHLRRQVAFGWIPGVQAPGHSGYLIMISGPMMLYGSQVDSTGI
jgi:hypothetical protein